MTSSEDREATETESLKRLQEAAAPACASLAYVRAQGLPLVPEDLARVPLVTSETPGHQLPVAAYQDDERREVMLHPPLMSETFAFLREAILAGVGVGLVPDKMFMLYMPNPHPTRAIKTFVDYILERSHPLIAPSLYRDRVDPLPRAMR